MKSKTEQIKKSSAISSLQISLSTLALLMIFGVYFSDGMNKNRVWQTESESEKTRKK